MNGAIATQYDQLAQTFRGMLFIASARYWIKFVHATRTSATTKAVEVVTSFERRRRSARAEKKRIVTAALEPSAVVSEVARTAGIHSSQLFR